MPRRITTAFVLLSVAAIASADDRRMAITFDDLPLQAAHRFDLEAQSAATDGILAAVVRHEIPAVGFVNEQKLEVDGVVDPARVELLVRWLEAGLELGNHTYSHPDLHRIPLAEFQDDLLLGERQTPGLAAEHGRPFRYFRHPFLHTGLDLPTKHDLERFLDDRGYTVAPVTIDNSEWIFSRAWDVASERGDDELLRRLGTTYVEYMVAMTEYYEGQSRALFGREIPQVLLVHANALNGATFDELAQAIRDRGYRFVTLDEALTDPAFESPDTYVGRGGITWIHRWALTRDVDRSIFGGEPSTPDWVQELAGIEE